MREECAEQEAEEEEEGEQEGEGEGRRICLRSKRAGRSADDDRLIAFERSLEDLLIAFD